MLKFWIWAGVALFPVAAGAAEEAARPATRDLSVTNVQIQRLAIKVEPVKATDEQVTAQLPGTVIPALNSRIVAATPFAGTVTQVHVLPGQRIEKGDALATISSRELLEAASTLAQGEAELQAAEANSRRRRALADKNIQNPTMADEAEAQVAKIKAVITQHQRALRLGGIKATTDGSYTIIASASGRVVETTVMPGDKTEAMAAAVIIDTSDEICIEAQVPAALVGNVSPGDRIRIAGGPEGKVVSVAGSLDKLTRSAKLIASVPTDSGLLPGQLVSVSIVQRSASGALSVPASAVARINQVQGVFVRSEKGFSLVPVEVAGKSAETATIIADIPHGAEVAASGLVQLEQMLGTE